MTFASFVLAGFECSSHRRKDRARVDVIAGTRHDQLAVRDYRLLCAHGLLSARDGLRWHLIERTAGQYDWSSWLPQLRAARNCGVQVMWDLMHWGYPDELDFHAPAFVDRFAAFARAAARIHAEEVGSAPMWVPVNEMSFWAWIGGHNASWAPYSVERGWDVKAQCARAALAATAELRAVDAGATIACAEPTIQIHRASDDDEDRGQADWAHDIQYEALEMLLGRRVPALGGHEDAVDLIGCNYYPNNQWVLHGPTVFAGLAHYRPPRELFAEVHARFGKPLFVAETGCEGSFRPAWLRFIADEVAAARDGGVPVEGICLYPILDHPGWDDDRHCRNGLFDGCNDRAVDQPLADEVAVQLHRFGAGQAG